MTPWQRAETTYQESNPSAVIRNGITDLLLVLDSGCEPYGEEQKMETDGHGCVCTVPIQQEIYGSVRRNTVH